MPLSRLLFRPFRIGVVQVAVDLGEVTARDTEEPQRLVRGSVEHDATLGHEAHVIALADVRGGVRHEDNRVSSVGQMAQREHHLLLQTGVQPGGGFIEEEQARLGEQLDGDTDSFALSSTETADCLAPLPDHLHLLQHEIDSLLDLRCRRIGREPELGGVAKDLLDTQLPVDDVILWDVSDRRAVEVEVAVEVVSIDEHPSLGTIAPVERTQEGRFPSSAGTHQRDELARKHCEAGIAQDALALVLAAYVTGQPKAVQSHAAHSGALLKSVCLVDQPEGSNLYAVALLQYIRSLEARAVHERAVEASKIGDRVALRRTVQAGVLSRYLRRHQRYVRLGTAPKQERGLHPQGRCADADALPHSGLVLRA